MTSEISQTISDFTILGEQIKVSKKAKATINKEGYSIKFGVETVSVNIGIGTDHVAILVMPKSAWDALNKGEEVSVTTLNQFKKGICSP